MVRWHAVLMVDGAAPTGPLDGVVVADFSRVLAGPYATMLLGDLGATVVKIESPTGDETREWMPPRRGDRSTYYLSVNRNKRSIALDLRTSADAAIARRIVDRADVLVENLLPGRMAAFGLGWEAVRETNPSLVYASISGFGDRGGADLPGYDLLVQAMSGFMSVTGAAEAPPQKAGFAIFDVFAGLQVGLGVLAALRHADRTGVGQWVRTDLLSVALSAMVNQSGAAVMTASAPGRLGNGHPSIFPYEPFPTADRDLVIAVGNDAQFARLCEVLGDASLATHDRFARAAARNEHRDLLRPLLVDLLSVGTADEWMTRLRAANVPCGVVLDLVGGLSLAAALGLAPIVEIDGDPSVRNPLDFSATPATYRLPAPGLDSGRRAVLDWLDGDDREPRS